MKTKEMVSAAMLSAISAAFQIIHIGYLTTWGMWIDFVAIPWIISYMVFGIRAGLLTSIVSFVLISMFSAAGWVGAFIKLVATLPMIVIPYVVLRLMGKGEKNLNDRFVGTIALLLAVLVRGLLVLPFNYYFAIPVFFGITTEEAMRFVPPVVMFVFNAIQGVIDFAVAWIIVFRFNIKRFSV